MTSGEFLERYTTQHTGPETGLPVIALKPDDALELKCPFVTKSGAGYCTSNWIHPTGPGTILIYRTTLLLHKLALFFFIIMQF